MRADLEERDAILRRREEEVLYRERLINERMEQMRHREGSEGRRESHSQTEWTYDSLVRREARVEIQRLAQAELERQPASPSVEMPEHNESLGLIPAADQAFEGRRPANNHSEPDTNSHFNFNSPQFMGRHVQQEEDEESPRAHVSASENANQILQALQDDPEAEVPIELLMPGSPEESKDAD